MIGVRGRGCILRQGKLSRRGSNSLAAKTSLFSGPSPLDVLKRVCPVKAVDILIEDVAVLQTQPDKRSVRAVVDDQQDVVLFSTDLEAMEKLSKALATPGTRVISRKVDVPNRDVLEQFLEGGDITALPEPAPGRPNDRKE
jgi:hypothetical protein